jgi:hypothetical protein
MRRIINNDGGVSAALDKILNRGSAAYSWAGNRRPGLAGPAVPPSQEPPAEA